MNNNDDDGKDDDSIEAKTLIVEHTQARQLSLAVKELSACGIHLDLHGIFSREGSVQSVQSEVAARASPVETQWADPHWLSTEDARTPFL